MLQSLRNIFSNNINQNKEDYNKDIDILAGLMIEAANTDGNISHDEVNKISLRKTSPIFLLKPFNGVVTLLLST